MTSLLRIANIEKSYSITKNQKQEVLKGVDAEFDRGELVALVGESGSGKSTLIHILGGLDHDYTGSVVVKGNFIRDFDEREMDDYRKKRVGMIFQNYNLINHMTLLENVEIAMRMSSIEKETRQQRALDLLDMVGLKEFSDKTPNQLSGGQQQRVAIARALANNPSIILADEPTGALDKESEELILLILKKIVESGKLVIIVTHSQVVANHCSRIVTLDDGIIISDEKRYEVANKGAFEKVIMPKPIQKRDLLRLSINNLKQKWNRSILVSVGMSIGIAAMIIILALSRGLTLYVEEVFGENIVSKQMVVTKDSYISFVDSEIDDIEDLDGVEEVIVSSYYEGSDYVYNGVSQSVDGISGYYSTFYPSILYGSLQLTSGNIMINETFAIELSGDLGMISVVGTEIAIEYNNAFYSFTISAIYEDLTATSDESNVLIQNIDFDAFFYADLTANQLLITVDEVSYLNTIIEDLENNGYTVYQDDTSATTVMEYLSLGTQVLTGVSGISMVVAAIMIFIVLYISIVERTKEIGILRAIGAQKKDIKHMFMYEAGILGLIGGVIGVVFAILVTLLTNVITEITMDASLMNIHFLYILLGILISISISIFAGIAPSIKASQLDPIESLRFE